MVPVYLGTVYLGVSNGNNTPRSFGQGVTTEKHLLLITVLITCGSESRDGHLNLITRANPNSMDAWYAFHKVGRLRYLTKYTGTESQREFPYGGTGIASIFTSIITYHRTSLCYISISCVGSPIAVRCQGKPSQRFTNVNVNNLCQSDTTLPKVFGSQLMHVLPPQATIIFM